MASDELLDFVRSNAHLSEVSAVKTHYYVYWAIIMLLKVGLLFDVTCSNKSSYIHLLIYRYTKKLGHIVHKQHQVKLSLI